MLMVYNIPEGVPLNHDFSVSIKEHGGEYVDVQCYNAVVELHDPHNASIAYFDFDGEVEVRITKNDSPIHMGKSFHIAAIRPLSYDIPYEIIDGILYFTLSSAANLSIEANGDRVRNLHLFAGRIPQCPDKSAADVICFPPQAHETNDILQLSEHHTTLFFEKGLHQFHDFCLKIPSGKTVFLEGGSVIQGTFSFEHTENAVLTGRGVIYQKSDELRDKGVCVKFSKNIRIGGFIIINPPHFSVQIGQSEDVIVEDIKSFSCNRWSDGISVLSSHNVCIDSVFMRNSDDCISIYGTRGDFTGDTRYVAVKNSTLWADVAHPSLIGTHGDYDHNGSLIENITFENIDILEHHEPQPNYLGCMAINAGDKNTIRHISFTDIRVEHFQRGRLFDIRVFLNKDYNPAPGKRIEDVLLKNIIYNGYMAMPSQIQGYDDERVVDGVTIENLRINGELILDAISGNIVLGEYARNIRFLG